MAAAARRRGLSFHPRDLLGNPTLAALAPKVTHLQRQAAVQVAAGGPIPLTPIQHWFFQLMGQTQDFFTQVRVLETHQTLDLSALRQALALVCARHEVLRLVFTREAGVWRQQPGSTDACFALIELPAVAGDKTQLSTLIAQQQAKLLTEAPVKLAACSMRRPRGGDLLVLVAHHLVIDGISWRILVEDLIAAYDQCAWGEPPAPVNDDYGFRLRAERLAKRALEPPNAAERAWFEDLRAATFTLPAALWQGAFGLRGDAVMVRRRWDGFGDLLGADAQRRYRITPECFLLTGLACALARLAGSDEAVVFLERHGRDDHELDLQHAIGWFTQLFPVRLPVLQPATPGELMRAVKAALQAVPEGGQAHGIGRYLRTEAMPTAPAQVLFNYMGGLDRARASAWPRMDLPVATRGAKVPRGFAIEINARLVDGQLRLNLSFCAHVAPETANALLDLWQEALRTQARFLQTNPGGALAPRDFPGARLSTAELEGLASRFPFDRPELLERLYRLSAFQEGQLYHGLLERAGEYRLQRAYRLPAGTCPDRWRQAWSTVIARHEVLRTLFVWRDLERPHQWVRRDWQPAWQVHDWRERSSQAQAQAWSELLETERAAPFQLDREPPYRLCLARVAEDTYLHLLTIHHILVDGWSLSIIWRELQRVYAALASGAGAHLPAPPSFGDWLIARDALADQVVPFWREELVDLPHLTLRAPQDGETFSLKRALSAERSADLLDFAAQRALTLFTLLQACFALTLAEQGGGGDLVFGTTLSGRGTALEGAERVVGPCCQTVPVRVRIERDAALALWLETLEERHSARERHAEIAMAELHHIAGVGAGARLFDCLLVYENFPRGPKTASARPALVFSHDRADYPLTLLIQGRKRPRFRLVVEGGALAYAAATAFLDRFVDLLARLPNLAFHSLDEFLEPVQNPLFRTLLPSASKPIAAVPQRRPETPLQRDLAELWSSLLGHAVEDIDRGFFELGGNSLLLIRLYGQLQRRFETAMSFAELFARPTVAALAELLEHQSAPSAAASGRQRADLRRNLRKR